VISELSQLAEFAGIGWIVHRIWRIEKRIAWLDGYIKRNGKGNIEPGSRRRRG